ncbi:MAG: (2Fe-2S)-binding protein [Alphaproteobacteria bacterium]|jgi:carbon-monoxide dehydrogenase small subunit|nr:(2Fe-2S)-binding protein [Rhodospirillaceae bacterium]MDP6407244.1 (2Fe-2S)-binding protein [Alphaproteobacteria bacterium]MDP6623696.1 (2Fe-2S)-binding protein [Alphaproteobacteria bacterium]|tara:strand:+ start:123 stop:605 length:483 start_codon:yes stop_codon:yes gene_type:complete
MNELTLNFTINGRREERTVPAHRTLLELIREELLLSGTKEGCGSGECGSCSVLLGGRLVNACLVLAAEAEGQEIVTIEGLAADEALHPVQQAFVDESGMQCGACTSGMVLAAKTLLEENPEPSRNEIREGLAGNLCRCTGYAKIFESVEAAAEALREAGP